MAQLEEAREALEAETASKHQELAALEQQILANSKVVEEGLKQLRERLEAREAMVAQREAELLRREGDLRPREVALHQREEQVQVVEKEQTTRLIALEAREVKVAEGEATYRERMDKANADFAEKRKKLEEENDVKVKLVRSSLPEEIVETEIPLGEKRGGE